MKIAFLGLGVMGSGMALRLVAAGFDVTVYNRNTDKARPVVDAGAALALSAAEAAKGADVIVSMLADDVAARAVWTDALSNAKPGFVGVESSTVSPGWVKDWAKLVAAKGGRAIDAPVTGSKAAAASGELVFLVGGDAAALDTARPALQAMSKGIVHLGPIGSGALVKLINNFVCGVQLASLAEALTMIDRAGLDQAKALEILTTGSPSSPFVKLISSRMAGGDDTVHFMLRLMNKDLGYARTEGEALGIDMKTATAAIGQVQRSVDAGFGDADISAIYQAMKDYSTIA